MKEQDYGRSEAENVIKMPGRTKVCSGNVQNVKMCGNYTFPGPPIVWVKHQSETRPENKKGMRVISDFMTWPGPGLNEVSQKCEHM